MEPAGSNSKKGGKSMATFTNQAALAYNNIVTNSNTVAGEIVEVLSATKTPISASYAPDDVITYAISIVNTGTAAFTNLTVSDNLGAYTFGATSVTPLSYEAGTVKYYVNGVLQTAPTVTAGPPLTFTGISVPAGGNALILYSARANSYAPLGTGGTVENTVTITGSGVTAPVTTTGTIDATTAARLSLTKAVSPASVSENQPITFTLTVANSGGSAVTAADNAVISDTFNPPLTITSVTYNGVAWTAPTNYTYNAATGAFATVAGQITVPAATYTQDTTTGVWETAPGIGTLVITGTM